MSLVSKLTGQDARRRASQGTVGQMDSAMSDEQSGAGWQTAFNQTAGAELAGALPGLRSQLQMTREDDIRRGISTGDTGTSNEGDIVSAWGRNIGNNFAGQAAGMFNQSRNRYLDLLSGKLGYNMNQENSNRNFYGGLISGGLQAGGQAAGMALGGY